MLVRGQSVLSRDNSNKMHLPLSQVPTATSLTALPTKGAAIRRRINTGSRLSCRVNTGGCYSWRMNTGSCDTKHWEPDVKGKASLGEKLMCNNLTTNGLPINGDSVT